MKVKDLIDKLKDLPQDKPVVCQVTGKNSGVWNMWFDVFDVESSWMVVLKVDHDNILDLPMPDNGIVKVGK